MNTQKLNILLADDDVDDRMLFKEALEEISNHHQLVVLNDGSELISHLNQPKVKLPDIIFLDVNMPRLSGIECLQMIKQSTTLATIPVVIYSTSSNPETVAESFEKGAALYMQKPSRFDRLVVMIDDIINRDWNSLNTENLKNRMVT